jgi:methanogenic corrinoid protein MtbC1
MRLIERLKRILAYRAYEEVVLKAMAANLITTDEAMHLIAAKCIEMGIDPDDVDEDGMPIVMYGPVPAQAVVHHRFMV